MLRIAKKMLLGSMIATAAVILAACTPAGEFTGEPTESAGPAAITVGIVTSETGPLAAAGKQYLDAFRAGLDYATDGTGEIGGTKITVDSRDDGGEPDKAVAAVDDLVGAGVNIIAGTVSSDAALAVAKQAEQDRLLYIAGPADADAITGVNDHTFRSGRQTAQDIATVGTFLDDIDGTTVTVLGQDNAFGKASAAAVDDILGAKGATVNTVLAAEDTSEFGPLAQQVLAGAPDLVFVAWEGATAGAMWHALSQVGVLDEIPVVTELGDSATYSDYGEASEKILFVGHYFPGAPDDDVNTAMVDALEAGGSAADLYSPDGFNAAIMIVHAIQEGKGDVDAMIKALEGFTFDGPKGSMTVRADDHALIQDMYQAKLVADNGAFVPELVDTISADAVAPGVAP